ncbi:MAG: glycosyltransferase family 4 protein [Planctomycetes bacterium]|nr:glycosyltransferase family 4 protein [Planctomycetota bacterium]
MRILVANQFGSVVGGAETYSFAIAKELAATGYRVGFAFADSFSNNINLRTSDGVESLGGHGSFASWLDAVDTFAPDVVYSQVLSNPWADHEIAKRWPGILFNHNYSGACFSGTKQFRVPTTKLCSRPLGPMCLAHYLPRRCGGLNPLTALRSYRREITRRETFRQSRAVCVASRHMRSVMIQNGVPESKVHLLPLFPTHGDRDLHPPQPRPRANTILFAGRITRLKGWTHLVPAIAMAAKQLGQGLALMVAGDGPDRDKLVRLAAKWNVPLDFRGWLGPEPLRALMKQADLLAVPSLWPEPFGLVGIEAGCVGTPAVAYGVGGIPDWLIPGVSGEMAPGDDLRPEPLAKAMVRALQDENHWQRLREGAWRQAGLFSRKSHLDRLLPILQEAADSR